MSPPNYSLSINGSTTVVGGPLAGTAYASLLEDTTWRIQSQFNRQGDTATFYVNDQRSSTTASYYIPPLATIVFTDTTNGFTLFSGLVTTPTWTRMGPNLTRWQLDCKDWTYLSDRAIVFGDFVGMSCDAILKSLITQANCGISAGNILGAPTINRVQINYLTLSQAAKKLANLASQTVDWGWDVNYSKGLDFFPQSSATSSGVTLTDNLTGLPTTTTGGYNQQGFVYKWDASDVRSAAIVRGANVPGTSTDNFRGDSVTSQWVLKYKFNPGGAAAILAINGFTQTADTTPQSFGGQASTVSWGSGAYFLIQSFAGPWVLIAATAPATGTNIAITYPYQGPIIARADNTSFEASYSTLPNGGKFVMATSDSTLVTLAAAQARAQAEALQYGIVQERVTLTTAEGWNGYITAGQLFTLVNSMIPDSRNSYLASINATMLALSATITGAQVGYRKSTIQAVRI